MRIIYILLLGLLSLGFVGCYGGTCEGDSVRTCSEYGRVSDCDTSGSTTRCTTRNQCVSWACCRYNGSGTSCVGGWPADPPSSFSVSLRTGSVPAKLSTMSVDQAMAMAANADIEAAEKAGLSPVDLMLVGAGQALESVRCGEIARKLDEPEDLVCDKVKAIEVAFQAQRAQANSPYWRTCMHSGRWATEKNRNCKETYWPGCSPATGATMCVSEAGRRRLKL